MKPKRSLRPASSGGIIEAKCAICGEFAGAIAWIPAGVRLPFLKDVPDDPGRARILVVLQGAADILWHDDPSLMALIRAAVHARDLRRIGGVAAPVIPFYCWPCDASFCPPHREPMCPSGHVPPWMRWASN